MPRTTPRKPQKPEPETRNRAATERALVDAAAQVLADVGFQGFGVNAVARAADCDKQLIYRYFGGVEGLVAAVGEDVARRLAERLAPLMAQGPAKTYAAMAERMALGFIQLLRDDKLLQRIAAWEIAGPSDLVDALTSARSKVMMQWMATMRGSLKPPPDIDAPAANALIIAACQHLVLSGSAAGQFSGLKLASEKDWDRVRATVKQLVEALYR